MAGQIKTQLGSGLGRKMALSSVYKLLHRHNWRKLAPDKRHPQSDPVAQEDWGETPRNARQIRQDWAKGELVRLMFQNEARFGRINDVRRCWAHKPICPLRQAMLTHEYTYAYAACRGEQRGTGFSDLAARQYRVHATVSQ